MFLDFINISSYVLLKIQKIFPAKHHSYQFSGSGLLVWKVPLKVSQRCRNGLKIGVFVHCLTLQPWLFDSSPVKTYLGEFIVKKDAQLHKFRFPKMAEVQIGGLWHQNFFFLNEYPVWKNEFPYCNIAEIADLS